MSSVARAVSRQFKQFFMSDKPPGVTVSDLEMSFDATKTITKMRKHKWIAADFQYVVLAGFLLFSFIVIENPPLILRSLIALLFGAALVLPITSQFFFPALPIFTWLILFYACQFIPASWRPNIHVRVLPAMETILYGGNLSNVLASYTCSALDLLAWIPYGIVHYCAPFVLAAVIFLFAPPKTLRAYAFAFGYMNLIGVLIQILFPASPPWYKNLHGLDPANYEMSGSAGGLARIDAILGVDMYANAFGASPMVFGAFPSLHSGCAVMETLFISYIFPRSTPYVIGYVLWIWWSTMYLTHHYFVDLIGGACLSFAVFYVAKYTILPRVSSDRFCRWSYETIELNGSSAPNYKKSSEFNRDLEFQLLPPINTSTFAGYNTHNDLDMNSPSTSTSVSSTMVSLFEERPLSRASVGSSPGSDILTDGELPSYYTKPIQKD